PSIKHQTVPAPCAARIILDGMQHVLRAAWLGSLLTGSGLNPMCSPTVAPRLDTLAACTGTASLLSHRCVVRSTLCSGICLSPCRVGISDRSHSASCLYHAVSVRERDEGGR